LHRLLLAGLPAHAQYEYYRLRPCTVFERFWRLLRWLCEVKRSGTEHSQRKQISIAFPSRAARRE
jgi:hypothetical protein